MVDGGGVKGSHIGEGGGKRNSVSGGCGGGNCGAVGGISWGCRDLQVIYNTLSTYLDTYTIAQTVGDHPVGIALATANGRCPMFRNFNAGSKSDRSSASIKL